MPISDLEKILKGLEKTFHKKIHIFKAFEESRFSTEKFEKFGFSDENFFQILLENFPEQIWT